MHAVLRPAQGRRGAGLREGVPDRLDPVRRRSTCCASGPTAGSRSCTTQGVDVARLYGHDPDDGVGGDGAFFLLLDEPEVYGLPPDPVVTTRDLRSIWRHVGAAAAAGGRAVVAAFVGGGDEGAAARPRRRVRRPTTAGRSSRRRRGSTPDVPLYLFLGGVAGISAVLAEGAAATGRPALSGSRGCRRRGRGLGTVALVHDLGRPERFLNMLRVFKPTSPLSVGSWILAPFGGLAAAAACCRPAGRLPLLGRLAGAGGRGARPAAGDVHRGAVSQHGGPGVARGAIASAVPLRRSRGDGRRPASR